jgi:hypothetical protein
MMNRVVEGGSVEGGKENMMGFEEGAGLDANR